MVERIDFYILDENGGEGCEQFTCRLTEKAYDQGHKIFIRAATPEQASTVDKLLWTYRQGSFCLTPAFKRPITSRLSSAPRAARGKRSIC
ncbi:hypothetical protein CAL65_06490 [Alkalilimnicola ehrlichii]|uniref:Uncharacterized protein n=1 Tax=Alkalilimnicola ehrlichii TaxID=351052 RepID=A0A3E0WYC7_9GAMM|nr:hypothetical protein CAL65_06490 [Alkalilimnicola ehrlichii]